MTAADRPSDSPAWCPNCGAPFEPGDAFCGECGARAEGAAPPEPPGRRAGISAGRIAVAVGAIGGIAAIAAAFFLLGGDAGAPRAGDAGTGRTPPGGQAVQVTGSPSPSGPTTQATSRASPATTRTVAAAATVPARTVTVTAPTTASATATVTPSPTATVTRTVAVAPTSPPTATVTPQPTQGATATATRSPTPTLTPVSTATSTPAVPAAGRLTGVLSLDTGSGLVVASYYPILFLGAAEDAEVWTDGDGRFSVDLGYGTYEVVDGYADFDCVDPPVVTPAWVTIAAPGQQRDFVTTGCVLF